MSKQVLTGAESKLEKHVQRIINSHGKDYDNGAAGFLRDVAYGGCASGVVGELIYYRDTVKFYRQHRAEISELLKETIQEYGAKGPGEKWDTDDPLASEQFNQNLLAWFAFEETARRLAYQNGIEY